MVKQVEIKKMNWVDKLFDTLGAFCAMYLIALCVSLVFIELLKIIVR